MKHAMVIYESSYGITHIIAEAIGEGLRETCAVQVLPARCCAANATSDVTTREG